MSDDILSNHKARRDYHIEETIEAGIALKGTEVKSLRAGRGNLSDAFAKIEKEQIFLYNCDIQPYAQGNRFNHEPKAKRRLLMHKAEIRKLFGHVQLRGRALVALKMYWKNGKVKVLIGAGTGKDSRDKRQDLKTAAVKREMDQALKASRRR